MKIQQDEQDFLPECLLLVPGSHEQKRVFHLLDEEISVTTAPHHTAPRTLIHLQVGLNDTPVC